MRFVQLNVLALTVGLLASHGVWAADPASAAEPRTAKVAMTFDNGAERLAHTAVARMGEPVQAVFKQDDQQIKIEYVIDYDAQGQGHIQTGIQTAAVHSNDWSPVSNFSASFLDGHEASATVQNAAGQPYTLAFTVEQAASRQVADNSGLQRNQ